MFVTARQTLKRVIDRYLKRILANSYSAYRQYFLARLALVRARASREVIIYQMGKVGSVTLTRSIRALPDPPTVHKVHTLTRAGIDRIATTYRAEWPASRTRMAHLWKSEHLYQRLDREGPWKVATLVRDPIARNVSDFFQVMDIKLGVDVGSVQTTSDPYTKAKDLASLFLSSYDGHDVPLTWFDNELGSSLNIDVFSYEFPKSTGYQIIRTQTVDLLILKLEALSACAEQAMFEWLNVSNFAIVRGNLARDSYYASVYSEFFDALELPSSYVERMYDSKYARHFYTQDELNAFRHKWQIS